MNGGDSRPVMTDSERRAYRYGREAPRLGGLAGMRKSWSNDSLASYGGGRATCVCAPTTHPGSFRCKHHRHASNLGAAAAAQVVPQVTSTDDAGAVAEHYGTGDDTAPADQEKSS